MSLSQEPPSGWLAFGTHIDYPGVKLEFSEELDEDGLPLWERIDLEHIRCQGRDDAYAQMAEMVATATGKTEIDIDVSKAQVIASEFKELLDYCVVNGTLSKSLYNEYVEHVKLAQMFLAIFRPLNDAGMHEVHTKYCGCEAPF